MSETTEKKAARILLRRQTLRGMKFLMLRFRVLMDERLRPMAMTTSQLQILFAIRDADGISGAQLARASFMTPQSVQTLLAQLESAGLIARTKSKDNERVLVARITAAGERTAKKIERIALEIQENLWRGISEAEIEKMHALLGRCLENLEGLS